MDEFDLKNCSINILDYVDYEYLNLHIYTINYLIFFKIYLFAVISDHI